MLDVLWLVYLADVVRSITLIFILLGIALLISFTIYTINYVVENSEFPKIKRYIALIIAIFLFSALIPSKEVVYIAAGYRAGIEIIETEPGKKAVQLLNLELDKLIAKSKTN
jgi:hypothetical protein